ncbi:MAG TPA: S9 family peptidase [Vicinamibacterales bacterium]|nr:S9 family peptidase [Vicinamibacterales bacterium]
MTTTHPTIRRALTVATLAGIVVCSVTTSPIASAQSAGAVRPMTFLDMRQMRNVGAPTPSPDGKWLLYTLSTPDWKEAKSQTDVYLVSMAQGVASTKQMTFTKEKNETSPRWTRDGRAFFFLSNREAPENAATRNQIFTMRPDGGEAQRVTDTKEGVRDYALTKDGRWLIYRTGKDGDEQLYRLPVTGIETASAEHLAKHDAGIGTWRIAPDDKRIYWVSADALDKDEKERREKKFTVNIRNMETPSASLHAVDLDTRSIKKLTDGTQYAATSFTISDDSKWVGFRGQSLNRYQRNITAESLYGDLHLLEVATGQVERLTNNVEVSEGAISFSPDSQQVAYTSSDDTAKYGMSNGRVYLRAVADRGKPFRKLGASFDGDAGVSFWSKDGSIMYFNEGIRATNQLMMLDVKSGNVRQATEEKASLSVDVDNDSGVVLITYADPNMPSTIFTTDSVQNVSSRASWRQLTDPNPQVKSWALGAVEDITWKSKDGTMVGGVLVRPVGYQQGQRYPLIVAIHGGPAAADVLGFNGGYGAQVYAGAGYAVLMPNYRGSTNYGLKHKTDIVGNYMQPGFDDIMSGVDHLIAQGIVDGSKMGALGWSAGGHWSNWILTHTDRFKAISSGAGTTNWISMYAQSDVQRNRQFYLGDKLPYDDFDAYWNQSPLKYIKNAKTPTMIHVVEGDPRVPSPQSVELHMALKQLGVPTELFMYPGNTHGIPDTRNQLVKSVSEMAWMDYYVRGIGKKFAWRDVLATLEEAARPVSGTKN